MSAMQPSYLTWLDVQRSLKQVTANFSAFEAGVTSIQCFADGAEIEYHGDKAPVKEWLQKVFGRALFGDTTSIKLEIGDKHYPLDLVPAEMLSEKANYQYPLWRDQAYSRSNPIRFPDIWDEGPKITAFHSFKGGVGRTTSLMTYAAASLDVIKDRPVRILLIDADLEAPGISFWLDPSNMPTVSFVHLLEALHYPPTNVDASLEYFAGELRKTSINAGGASREIFVLPAALCLSEIMDMPVQPEHIARNPENPWLLSEYLRALGQKLQVDAIFVDLRAGLSELASPLLFDPRVEHFFVTTVARQSVSGMAEVLKRVYLFQQNLPEVQRCMAKPSLVLSLLTPQLRQLPDYTVAIQQLNEAYPTESDEPVSSGLELIETEFEPALMSVGSIRQALEFLRKSSLYSAAAQWAEARSVAASAIEPTVSGANNLAAEADALFTVCERFQFAERTAAEGMLVTEPLRNLAKHYSIELPNAVSVGAKGAGKTFTYLVLCKSKSWEGFLQEIGNDNQAVHDGMIFPLLWSTNIDGSSRELVQKARRESLASLCPSVSQNSRGALRDAINKALRFPDTDWDTFWADALIREFSVGANSLSDFNDWLVKSNRKLVFVVDGVEDMFENPEDENQKRAIKALLQLPNQLNDLNERRIGIVCFVRADYVQTSIRQNVSQYLARFQPFRLEWNAETFLRLAYWICGKAGIIGADYSLADHLTSSELLIKLEKLWGKKMGRDDSKEAVTARWAFAALCDLNGRLQARDLVRFLKFAAKRMKGLRSEAWRDRVLVPEAIRKSLPDCSDEKVSEAIIEVAALRKWKEVLDTLPQEMKKTPFSIEALNLPSDLLNSLRELGVVYEDADQTEEPERFYLPEIYRSGLGFRSAVGGRPRVQALLKRNLGGMPF